MKVAFERRFDLNCHTTKLQIPNHKTSGVTDPEWKISKNAKVVTVLDD
jgi:hypothetical protein